LGFKVRGKVAPVAANPVPDTDAALTVTAEFPVEDRTTFAVAGISVTTSPKSTLVVLKLRMGDEVMRLSEKFSETPPTLAESVADSAEFTGEIFAVKLALVAPAATVTELGTVTNELLLARPTVNPPLAAAVFSVTVQLSVPDPIIDPLVQLNPVSPGTPVPLRATTIDVPFEELLVSESCPVSAPARPGANCTLSVAV